MKRAVPRIHLVGPLDGVVLPEAYPAVAALAADAGVDAVHARLPGMAGGDVFRLAQELDVRLRNSPHTTLFVNDRVDVAVLVKAGGVHLGERSLTLAQARALVSDEVLIGRSVHDVAGAIQAQEQGADFLMAGHVFTTGSKPGQPGRGVEWITELAESVSIPIVAIGGISVGRVRSVINAGAWGIAMGREILTAPDPAAVVRAICEEIEQE